MPKEFLGRIHGDGQIWGNNFDKPLNANEISEYQTIFLRIIKKAGISITLDKSDPYLPTALLLLKQRFMIGFSNGCPWPEKVINSDLGEFIKSEGQQPSTLKEVADLIRKSTASDSKRSMLFQILLQFTSDPLKSELLSFHPWTNLDQQENQHLPNEITDSEGKGAFGLAFDPPYFEIMVPLYKFIDEGENPIIRNARLMSVNDFLEKKACRTNTLAELIKLTKKFLANPKYIKQYLPRTQ